MKHIKYIYMFSSLIFSVFDSSALSTMYTTYTSAHIHEISISISIPILICGFFDRIFNLFLFFIQLVYVRYRMCSPHCVCVENYWFKFKTDVVVQSTRVLSQSIQIVSKTDKKTECNLSQTNLFESFNNKSMHVPCFTKPKEKLDIRACMPTKSDFTSL